jgi:RHS repeat-associated protein
MRWVLMLFVILTAVMGGEARAAVGMGRVVVMERVGKAEEKAVEALRVESERAFLGADEATGLVDGGPLVLWFPGGVAVARTFCDADEALEWDGENRLSGMWRGPWKEELAQVPFESLVGKAVEGSTVWRWGYDHRSRRVQRDEPGSDGERLRTVTVFSGGTSAAEYTVTGSAWTVPPAATVQHVRGPDLGGGTKGLLYSLRRSLQPNEQSTWLPTFNRYNGRGDVVAQSDIDGTTTWAASYQADGRRTAEAGTNVERHRACTKEEDPTGLLNEGFRYRDMETGTFISRDPLGLVDGPNVYCYVRQNPWTMWDPEGLWAIADDAIAMGVGAVLGVAAQGVSDVWHGKLSGWEDYAASGVGGALAGEAALYTGGLASGAVYGASANLTRQGLRNLSGKQSGFDCNSLVAETAVCAVGGKLGEVAAPYLSRTVARAMQKESSVAAAGSTTALNAEVKATGDVLESTIAPAAEAGAANNAGKINVGALDFSTGANKAVFYSGPGNHGRAMAFAERTGATPIDLTPGGQYLNSLKLYDTMPAAQADAIWAQASQAYASGAQGKINLFVNGARPDRVFHTIEAPIIKANSNIYKQTFHY